jgi:alpha-D-ribose 1-methylphosphonate 5-triphosphate diphosphatase
MAKGRLMIERAIGRCRIVTADAVVFGTLRFRAGVIADIAPGADQMPAALDWEGDYLIPGLVELHTDNLERHMRPRPGVAWPSAAAIVAHDAQVSASGITTVLDAIGVGYDVGKEYRRDLLPESLAAIVEADHVGALRSEHLLHLRCEVGDPEVVEELAKHVGDPRLRLVSLMDHTPGQRQFVQAEKYKEYYRGTFGLSEAELDNLIAKRIEQQHTHAGPNRARIADLCRDRSITMASHDDGTVEQVEESLALGLTVAEFPTTLPAALAARAGGMATIMGAPNVVLGRSQSGNLSALEAAKHGALDALSSDYVPISLIHGAFRLADQGGLGLPAAIATVSRHPAQMVGLPDRGEIAPGKRADFVRVAMVDRTPVVREVWRGGHRVG